MATVHMSEAEVSRDLHAALAQVQQGVEIIIEPGSSARRCAETLPIPAPGAQTERVHRPRESMGSQARRRAGPGC
jgi:hypothetical protein